MMIYITPAVESEKTILGAILLDNDVLDSAIKILAPNDFAIYFHEEIFQAMIKLREKYTVVDIPMLIDYLGCNEEEEVYLLELVNHCTSTANVNAHSCIVREKSVQKKLSECAKIMKYHQENLSSLEILARYLEETAQEIRSTDIEDVHLTAIISEALKAISDFLPLLKNKKYRF